MYKELWKVPEGNGFRESEISFIPTNEKVDYSINLKKRMGIIKEEGTEPRWGEESDNESSGSRASQSDCSNGPVSCVLSSNALMTSYLISSQNHFS